MPVTIEGQTYFRTGEVCRLTGISRSTLFRWLKQGLVSTPASRDWRRWRLFEASQVQEIKARTGLIIFPQEDGSL
jgi:excisionase family DNA binding protein